MSDAMPAQDEEAAEGANLLSARLTGSVYGTETSGRGKRDFLLYCCRTFNLITGICALLCAIALGIAIILQSDSPVKGLYEFTGQVLRVFGILIAGLLILVETEWQRFMYWFPTLDYWVGRGVLQVFEAILTYREAISVGGTDLHKSLQLYRSAACLSLLCCAAIYMLGGMLCIGVIRRARFRREEALLKAQADLDALEKRREELQRMLGRASED